MQLQTIFYALLVSSISAAPAGPVVDELTNLAKKVETTVQDSASAISHDSAGSSSHESMHSSVSQTHSDSGRTPQENAPPVDKNEAVHDVAAAPKTDRFGRTTKIAVATGVGGLAVGGLTTAAVVNRNQ